MDDSWRELREPHERIRWARLNRTNFERPTDAARSMNVKPGTYRTWEIAKADNGRVPDRLEIQRIGKKFGVSWVWLMTGTGSPDDEGGGELLALSRVIANGLASVPDNKREDALRAVEAVLTSYKTARSA